MAKKINPLNYKWRFTLIAKTANGATLRAHGWATPGEMGVAISALIFSPLDRARSTRPKSPGGKRGR